MDGETRKDKEERWGTEIEEESKAEVEILIIIIINKCRRERRQGVTIVLYSRIFSINDKSNGYEYSFSLPSRYKPESLLRVVSLCCSCSKEQQQVCLFILYISTLHIHILKEDLCFLRQKNEKKIHIDTKLHLVSSSVDGYEKS